MLRRHTCGFHAFFDGGWCDPTSDLANHHFSDIPARKRSLHLCVHRPVRRQAERFHCRNRIN
jgi:hypothetical protein